MKWEIGLIGRLVNSVYVVHIRVFGVWWSGGKLLILESNVIEY